MRLSGKPVVAGSFLGPRNPDNLIASHMQDQLAAHPAVRACRLYLFLLPRSSLANTHLGPQRARRADLHATSTEFARAVFHRRIHAEADPGVETAVDNVDRFDTVDVGASPHAAPAQDAFVAVYLDEGIGIIDGQLAVCALHVTPARDAILVGQVLQLAISRRLASHTVQRVVGDQQFERELSLGDDLGRMRGNDHAFGDRERTGRLKIALARNLYQTDAASTFRRQGRMVAQNRDMDATGFRRLQHGLPGLCLNQFAIDRDIYGTH